ncbi:nicotinate-nucleotide adenylyltransferase [Roseospirillum parvum]|uniref:Probable nicotinate-nucleotide adenylyltransferase n=1 Tax=Roseospirillum parvum TaxID=83401 RepID=A0A1G7ZKK4_9PROT|nr:nicotinate-nucleotide adenylyltransferase [Roseospirillum parvum]SDH09272.1 nicotinate-nucleotide adenylyltransferase [Roseospirillum parvum]
MSQHTLSGRRGVARPAPFGDGRQGRIGILGGSFNPAHDGHRHISLIALKRLRLDAVWWLVTPQNPLKAPDGTLPLDHRLAAARAVADHPRLVVTDLETHLGTVQTAETLKALTRRFPRARFVWLMGADNLAQFHRWHRWRNILETLPVAVFDRGPHAHRALLSRAGQAYAARRLPPHRAGQLIDRAAPAWAFLPIRRHHATATAIRHGSAGG